MSDNEKETTVNNDMENDNPNISPDTDTEKLETKKKFHAS